MKIVIQCPEVVYQHEFFTYLHNAEKKDIFENVKNEKSLIVLLQDNEEDKLFAVFDFFDDKIHVREISGKRITRYIGAMETFLYALCKKYSKNVITVCSDIDGIKWLLQKMKYSENEFGEFCKEVK